uniref:NIDO domain-containing protein n=1 Tax=Sinocyclocheilus anshuiensis TaxID=1608454 RepID=A0A671KPP0_9TELE
DVTPNDRSDDGISPLISLLQPFRFFGQTYNQLYINNNGYLTFDWPWYSYFPYQFPGYGGEDLIAPFWTDIDNRGNGFISYRQYSSGSVLTEATQDINQYFPDLSFSATWVFVATWDRVAYYPYSGTETSFQVMLISDGHFSFVLFNYGTIAPTQRYAGYDTISSTYHFSITGSLQYNITSLTYSSNVNVPGRWVFRTDHGSWAVFYPFGAGDIENDRSDDGSSSVIYLLHHFIFFGQTYSQIYVNNNGHLTFNGQFHSYTPYQFPGYGEIDLIAPFWTDIDNEGNGVISYRQYTSGSVLTEATQDINQYFPELSFSATWVFVATWDRVAYFPLSGTVRIPA